MDTVSLPHASRIPATLARRDGYWAIICNADKHVEYLPYRRDIPMRPVLAYARKFRPELDVQPEEIELQIRGAA